MEDVLIALFQLLFEALACLPWDFLTYSDFGSSSVEDQNFGWALASLVLGGVIGGVSLLMVPDVIARWPWLRVTLLGVTPFVSGALAYGLARLRQRRGGKVRPSAHFVFSWLFTLGLVVVRFTYAHRPGL